MSTKKILTLHSKHSGKRYSSLKLINQSTVRNLSLAWVTPIVAGSGPDGLGGGAAAGGFRLDIPSGTSVRFEPGIDITVGLVALGGAGHVPGLQVRR